jgi:SAM-dependent methyltransferase
MAHKQQHDYVSSLRTKFPKHFFQKKVLEIGSLNINGTNRDFFNFCDYLGVDVGEGPCVDIVCSGHELDHPEETYDTVLSTECFEHNPHWVETFQNMYRMCKENGMIFMTCATTGRPEHGTTRTSPYDSPLTIGIGWDYYKNLTEQDFRDNFDLDSMFDDYYFEVCTTHPDLYFYGFKKAVVDSIKPVDFRQFFIEKYYNNQWMSQAKIEYDNANPFPHIVIDNFLPPEVLDAILAKFPKPGEMDWWAFNNNNEIKLGSKNEVQIPQVARNVLAELNSGYILDWLEPLTGVPGLIADTRLIGGGLHQIQRGGKLGVHLDFNIEPRTKMARQLNLLIYLNKDWQEDWGGHLELWNEDKTECIKKVEPIFNRCVIFNTTGKSWHGHPHPLNTPENVTRKSLALYYYNTDNKKDYHNTIF